MLVVLVVLVLAVGLGVYGVLNRKHASSALVKYTDASAAPPVSVVQPTLQENAREIVLPGNMQAFRWHRSMLVRPVM